MNPREIVDTFRKITNRIALLDRLLNRVPADTAAMIESRFPMRPPIGDYQLPTGLMNFANIAPTSGRVTFLPIDILKVTEFSHVAYRIGTNASGGTTLFTAAIYADNGDGNGPDLTRQLAHTPTGDPLTSGTNKELALDAPLLLTPGRYWVGSLYHAATAPATNPTMHHGNSISLGWSTPGVLWFSGAYPPRCLQASGQTVLPTSAISLTAGFAEQPILVFLKRSA